MFHLTTYDNAVGIIANGFVDGIFRHSSGDSYFGVWLTDTPSVDRDDPRLVMAKVDTMLELHFTAEAMNQFAGHRIGLADNPDGRRDFAVSAELINRLAPTIFTTGEGESFHWDPKNETYKGPARPSQEVANGFPGLPMTRLSVWVPVFADHTLEFAAAEQKVSKDEAASALFYDALSSEHDRQLSIAQVQEHPRPPKRLTFRPRGSL